MFFNLGFLNKNNNKTKKKRNKEVGLLGIGKHGRAYTLGYKNKINQFQVLDNEEIKSIEIYGLNKNIKIKKKDDIDFFKDFLRKTKNKFVKIMDTDKKIGREETIKKDFFEELGLNKNVLKIYGKYSNDFLTVQPIGVFKGVKVMASIVTNDTGEKYHLIFGSKCDNNFSLNSSNLKKYMVQILESIEILQNKGFQHDDVKLDNTVYCDGTYKLIDWGKLRSINRVTLRTVFGLNHSPIFLYIYKTHGKISKIIKGLPTLEAFKLEEFLIKNFDKSLLWMRNLLNYPLFKKNNERVEMELKEIISENPSPKKLLDKYKYTSDIYMFGIAIIYILYKFKINPKKFKPIVEKFTSLKDPIKDASDAIKFVNETLR